MYLFFAVTYQGIALHVSPVIPFSTINNISISVSNSNFTFVFLRLLAMLILVQKQNEVYII